MDENWGTVMPKPVSAKPMPPGENHVGRTAAIWLMWLVIIGSLGWSFWAWTTNNKGLPVPPDVTQGTVVGHFPYDLPLSAGTIPDNGFLSRHTKKVDNGVLTSYIFKQSLPADKVFGMYKDYFMHHRWRVSTESANELLSAESGHYRVTVSLKPAENSSTLVDLSSIYRQP